MFKMMGKKLSSRIQNPESDSDVCTSPKTAAFTKLKKERCMDQEKTKTEMPALDVIIPDCSNYFGKVLVQISRQITSEELSNLKLMTMANKKIRMQDFDRLKSPGDFLSLLLRRNYYNEKDTSFLEEILEEVGRKDLSKMLYRCLTEHGGGDGIVERDGDPEDTESPSGSLEGHMSVDGSLERDDYREEEPMQSSQNSISDDEKLQILQGDLV